MVGTLVTILFLPVIALGFLYGLTIRFFKTGMIVADHTKLS